MSEKYIPQIREASIPENGTWIRVESQPFLLLSLPEWKNLITEASDGFRYVWMYDRQQDAYLFCFRFVDSIDYAIAFPKDHAGILLKDEFANQTFSIMITAKDIHEVKDQDDLFILPDIRLIRHPKAGW